MRFDCHTHTTYSDGWDWREMAAAAYDSGLEGIGFTDHCVPYEDPFGRHEQYPFTETYLERRQELVSARNELEIECYDGVELNYDPAHEPAIRAFLEAADFDYVIGSVHYAGEFYVGHPDALVGASAATKREALETYVDWQLQLVDSGLFDVLGHLDLTQRSPSLRGLMRAADYRRLAEALATSDIVPEINAGRLDRTYGEVHPHPAHLDVFRELDVPFVLGTDSHAPDQLQSRIDLLDTRLDELDVDVVDLPDIGS